MKAYLLKYKGEILTWELAHDDCHECESDNCCYYGYVHVSAGIPVYPALGQLLSTLHHEDWNITRSFTKSKHLTGYDFISKKTLDENIPGHYSLPDSEFVIKLVELGLTIHEITL